MPRPTKKTTEKRRDAILKYIETSNKPVPASEIAEKFRVSHGSAVQILQYLFTKKSIGLLQQHGKIAYALR